MTPSRYDLDRTQVAALLDSLVPGAPAYRTTQVWEGLYRQFAEPWEMTALPGPVRSGLAAHPAFGAALTQELETTADSGRTVKWLWRLADGALIETVLMCYPDRATVCVSSQAGCAMGCTFCATGQAGFARHLSTGEIVEQVARAARAARGMGRPVSRVVWMGMGEPLANYDATLGAVRRLHDDVGLSARHLTISTVGVVPGIRRLTEENLPVTLAVSLHAANDEKRSSLVPLNRTYGLTALAAACSEYVARRRRRLTFEWALIDGVNDTPADAAELASYSRPLGAHVNLIPLNPTPGYPVLGSPPARVRGFAELLTSLGVNATVRQTRGRSIDAACGQLAAPARRSATL